MARPVLHDAVTLNHFGAADRLDVLQGRHAHLAEPRWAKEVRQEVENGVNTRNPHCQRVLNQVWLGEAHEILPKDQKAFFRIWIGLNEGRQPPEAHRGEAESIFFAELHDGKFLTDDNGAYDFACKRPLLGIARVIDSIDVLRDAVEFDEITAVEASEIATSMENSDRSLRPLHRGRISSEYFQRK